MGDLIVSAVSPPGIMFSAGETSARRFMEFFTAQIRNPNTRKAYIGPVGPKLTFHFS
ncbi:hypothetical protein RRU01S_31_00070 [Agrobacterium rubi TR3 = NBRC 13261]|uniref:Uncharacterized protein n=1 Tax=Agrobacterium rubi TR3 = NBRC 13261 TaxID=1368415 RepID=A0A081D2C7_9HYPH|nr:hypothetical protein [Agrobacterium rubi]MBP1881362.1 hypothetical protein [Agrobacterium rubi]GAK73073.1 hypothetical protein RRU01S_31_00070 [Agrobacterium rubi TR3 = NBRC 13261]